MTELLEALDPALRSSAYGRCQVCWCVVKAAEYGNHQQWHLLLLLSTLNGVLVATDTDTGDRWV